MEGEAADGNRLEDDEGYKRSEEATTTTNEVGDNIEGNIIVHNRLVAIRSSRSGDDTGRYHIIQYNY